MPAAGTGGDADGDTAGGGAACGGAACGDAICGGAAGASAIAAALPSALYLKKLNLYQNHIGDDGCRALALALETNQVLEWLHIGNNDFGDDGVFTIAQCLRLQNNTLQFLDLSHNGITHLGEHHLRHALEKNQSVQKLMWGTTNVRDMRITVGFPKIRMGGI